MQTATEYMRGRKDLVEASKAIYDAVRKSLDSKFKDMEASLHVRAAKAIEKDLWQSYQKKLDEQRDYYEDRVKGLEDQLFQLRTSYEDRITKMQSDFGNACEALKLSYQTGVERVEKLLEALKLPAPTVEVKVPAPNVEVRVPENAIKIEQSTPEVHLPPGSILVEIEQSTPIVNLPADAIKVQLEKSIVNVQMPEQPAPKVEFKVPKRRVEKEFTYHPDGRPAGVIEREVEND